MSGCPNIALLDEDENPHPCYRIRAARREAEKRNDTQERREREKRWKRKDADNPLGILTRKQMPFSPVTPLPKQKEATKTPRKESRKREHNVYEDIGTQDVFEGRCLKNGTICGSSVGIGVKTPAQKDGKKSKKCASTYGNRGWNRIAFVAGSRGSPGKLLVTSRKTEILLFRHPFFR